MQFFLGNIFRYYRVWSKLIKCYHILNFWQLVYFSYSSTTVYQEWSNNFYIHMYIYISKSDNCPVILRKSACRQSRPEKNHYNLSDKRENQPRMHYAVTYASMTSFFAWIFEYNVKEQFSLISFEFGLNFIKANNKTIIMLQNYTIFTL